MQQYVIIARDGTDEAALDRRMKVRPDHFATARELKSKNQFVTGGAMLDEAGKMSGSVIIVQFETEDELNDWLSQEPYLTGKVWQQVEIRPFRVADI